MNKKTLEITLLDSGNKTYKISIANPKDNIETDKIITIKAPK